MKTVIHIQTQDCRRKAIKAFGSCYNPVLDEKGDKTINDAYDTFGSETCIRLNSHFSGNIFITFSSREFYKKEGFEILAIYDLIR